MLTAKKLDEVLFSPKIKLPGIPGECEHHKHRAIVFPKKCTLSLNWIFILLPIHYQFSSHLFTLFSFNVSVSYHSSFLGIGGNYYIRRNIKPYSSGEKQRKRCPLRWILLKTNKTTTTKQSRAYRNACELFLFLRHPSSLDGSLQVGLPSDPPSPGSPHQRCILSRSLTAGTDLIHKQPCPPSIESGWILKHSQGWTETRWVRPTPPQHGRHLVVPDPQLLTGHPSPADKHSLHNPASQS